MDNQFVLQTQPHVGHCTEGKTTMGDPFHLTIGNNHDKVKLPVIRKTHFNSYSMPIPISNETMS